MSMFACDITVRSDLGWIRRPRAWASSSLLESTFKIPSTVASSSSSMCTSMRANSSPSSLGKRGDRFDRRRDVRQDERQGAPHWTNYALQVTQRFALLIEDLDAGGSKNSQFQSAARMRLAFNLDVLDAPRTSQVMSSANGFGAREVANEGIHEVQCHVVPGESSMETCSWYSAASLALGSAMRGASVTFMNIAYFWAPGTGASTLPR